MADQKINELPTKTAPSTGDKMLMIGAAEEYQIDYDKLASAILDKLATKQYSELDTTAKTVLGALDELNSKTFLLKYGIEINANEDLNNLVEPGTYFSKSSTITGTLTNCPMSIYGFFMTVSYATGTDPLFIRQTIYGRTDTFIPIMYVRHKSSSEWGEWCSFSDDAALFRGISIQSGDDLNDYTIPGIYNSSSSGITATLLNMPEIFGSGFSLLVLPISTAANVQVIYMGGAGGWFYIRSATSSGWQSWYKLEGTVISS